MKNIVTTFILISCFQFTLWAQQQPHYTHFMQNKLAFNPAYAGSHEVASISALGRMQWIGMDDAPRTQTIFAHLPLFENRIGFGIGLIHDSYGPVNNWNGSMSYAYRFPLGKGKLSIGIQGSILAQQVRWTQLTTTDLNDPLQPLEDASKVMPGIGTGAYYFTDKYYTGISIPNLIRNSLEYTNDGVTVSDAKEVRHLYWMSGAIFDLTENIKIKPSILFKYVYKAPFDADINVSLLFVDKLWVGVTYRLEDAIAGLVGYEIGDQLRLGISYDYTLSKLQKYNNGSFEVFAEYSFRYKNNKLMNPRFFF